MRNLIVTLLATLFVVSACTPTQFQVKGNISDAAGETLLLEKLQLDRNIVIDSVVLGNSGRFSFKGSRLEVPSFFRLSLSPSNFITLLLDSIEQVKITADGKGLEDSYRLEGSLESKKVQILNQRLKKLRSSVDSLITLYQSLQSKEEVERKNEIGQELVTALDEHKNFVGTFVMDNPRSFASYYALFQRLSDNTLVLNVMDKKEQVYFATIATSLNLLYPESPRVKQLYNYVLSAKAEQQRSKISELLASESTQSIPEINEKDVNGQEVALSSLKGNVVLLSFWASWDQSSVRENENLKKIYNDYHKKGFEIYQVSLDRSKVLWENAIVSTQLPWINVSDLRYTDSYPARIYNIKQLPANYLISREGDIIGKNLYGDMLREKLKELL